MTKTNDNGDAVVARWETKGNDWLELYHSRNMGDYYYRGNQCGGGVVANNDQEAVEKMEARGGPSLLAEARPPLSEARSFDLKFFHN